MASSSRTPPSSSQRPTTVNVGKSGLFNALLKYWRGARGMSQLDLALSADVSSRHLSFLETGRAKPSHEMIITLCDVLQVPLRDQNQMLQAAGFEPAFAEPPLASLSPAVERAIDRMMHQQEPYPMVLMDRCYNVLQVNRGGAALLGAMVAEPEALAESSLSGLNGISLLFDPRLARPHVIDWERAARAMLSRVHREALMPPQDGALHALLDVLYAFPGVPKAWRTPDFSVDVDAAFSIRLKKGDLEVGFLTTMTSFSAPQNVTLDELRIESYFPLDAATEEICQTLAKTPTMG